MVREGQVVSVRVVFVADYAVWVRTTTGEVGMVPFEEDLDDDEELPSVGETMRVCVVRILDPVGQEQHSDITFDNRIRRVDFLGRLA